MQSRIEGCGYLSHELEIVFTVTHLVFVLTSKQPRNELFGKRRIYGWVSMSLYQTASARTGKGKLGCTELLAEFSSGLA